MNAQGMQPGALVRELDNAVQNAATGAGKYRYIDILPTDKWVHAQYRIAVVALAVNRVTAIGKVWPGLVCQVFEVGLIGIGKAFALGFTLDGSTVNFLQKDDVCPGFRDSFTHGIQYKAAVAGAIAFMDVIGENVYFLAHD